jgi:hypothetical protein
MAFPGTSHAPNGSNQSWSRTWSWSSAWPWPTDHSGHGHDHDHGHDRVYGHDPLRLSRDQGFPFFLLGAGRYHST